ncbi:hypothetical protein APHNP_0070 [Anaplasma phagocytophilum str. ApNP]|uniref:Uncharacterized protein n=1 Tax=Anaplasma phagocytophilum str. ApNP TaxID=1359153 RepID=A0A0F3NJ24_ANAPH|nr:hypothetical protein APHNP_0070 [Anaplasma phagocytophilum str. ApNP]
MNVSNSIPDNLGKILRSIPKNYSISLTIQQNEFVLPWSNEEKS